MFLIIIISFQTIVFAQTPNNAELNELGRQGVEVFLRGYLFKSRKLTESCWKNNQLTNLYLAQYEFVSGDDRDLLKKIIKSRNDDLLKLESSKIIPIEVKRQSTKPKFNYTKDGNFLFRFNIQDGKKYVSCQKLAPKSDLKSCLKPILSYDPKQAFTFELILVVMTPKDDLEKNSLVLAGKPTWMVMLGKPEPTHFKLIKSECDYRQIN